MHDISDSPAGRQPVCSQCVFKVTHNGDGYVQRDKALIVAKCYSQINALNDDGTFAPAMRYDSLCLIIALATHLVLDTDQLDIKSAFLNGYLV